METLKSHFVVTLRLVDVNGRYLGDKKIDDLKDNMDLVLDSMLCKTNPTIYTSDGEELIYFFKTEKRKRKGQLNKFCQRHLKNISTTYEIYSLTKEEYDIRQVKLNKNKSFQKISNEIELSNNTYTGEDIKIFEDKKKWYSWQKNVYKMFFDDDGNFIEAHPRHIYSLVDFKGNSGKSSFFKYLFFKHKDNIGRFSYGTASQLRSSLVNIGERKLYIIDLPRTKSKYDNEAEILSVVEDLKSGFVSNAMYGAGNHLMIEPPHIVLCSNYTFTYESLSQDRWQIFEIKDQKLGPKNKLVTKMKRQDKVKK